MIMAKKHLPLFDMVNLVSDPFNSLCFRGLHYSDANRVTGIPRLRIR